MQSTGNLPDFGRNLTPGGGLPNAKIFLTHRLAVAVNFRIP
jgi:hypothetical protein